MDSNNNLENRTLVSSPELSIEIVEVIYIQKRGRKGYEIFFVGGDLRQGRIHIESDGKNFVKRLLKEDKLLAIMKGEKYLAVYGSLEEGKFYTLKDNSFG